MKKSYWNANKNLSLQFSVDTMAKFCLKLHKHIWPKEEEEEESYAA